MSRNGNQLESAMTSNFITLSDIKAEGKDEKCNFGTRYGQYTILAALLVAGFLPSSILTVQNIVNMAMTARLYKEKAFIEGRLEEIGKVVYEIQRERGLTTLYITSRNHTAVDIRAQWDNVDEAVNALSSWPKVNKFQEVMGSASKFRRRLERLRMDAELRKLEYKELLQFYNSINEGLIGAISDVIKTRSVGDQWKRLFAYLQIAYANEMSGIERARGSVFWNKGMFTQQEYLDYGKYRILGQKYFDTAKLFSKEINDRMTTMELEMTMNEIDTMRAVILSNNSSPSLAKAQTWFHLMSTLIDTMKEAQETIAFKIGNDTVKAGEENESATTSTTIQTILEFAIYPVFVALSFRLVFKMRQVSSNLVKQTKKLTKERNRRMAMVKEMYPSSVADRLLQDLGVDPESFELVTVCFAVISDFDSIVAGFSPSDVVSVINQIFEHMDDEVIKYDMFKVETMEDMFLLVSGVPITNGTEHVVEIASMCINLRNRMANVSIKTPMRHGVKLRFGVCTGPVVAGIVGHKMPRYLLFGDTVNIASRMQSTTTANGIHLDPTAGDLLSLKGGYTLEKRCGVEIKGRGAMDTYMLICYSTTQSSSLLRAELF